MKTWRLRFTLWLLRDMGNPFDDDWCDHGDVWIAGLERVLRTMRSHWLSKEYGWCGYCDCGGVYSGAHHKAGPIMVRGSEFECYECPTCKKLHSLAFGIAPMPLSPSDLGVSAAEVIARVTALSEQPQPDCGRSK